MGVLDAWIDVDETVLLHYVSIVSEGEYCNGELHRVVAPTSYIYSFLALREQK